MGKNEISLEQTTAYPEDGDIEIAVNAPRNLEFAVAVRIPAWSKVSRVAVNGESIGDVRPGTYVTVRRRWEPGDKISVNLDMRGRLVELNGYQAIERGRSFWRGFPVRRRIRGRSLRHPSPMQTAMWN